MKGLKCSAKLWFLFLVMVTVCLSTVSSGSAQNEPPYKISIMTQCFDIEPMPDDGLVMKALEEYTNTDLEIIWSMSTTYDEKLNITMASGDLPMIVLVTQKSPSVINACRAGAFWEIGPYLKEFPNLSQANEVVLNNISIDGKVYGIYRARDLGRYGIIYRKDWLKNVGLSEPKTIDDFYEMLKRFTYNDPDQNGINDTYGMVIPNPSMYDGPFEIMLTWFGGPNRWREKAKGELEPAHLTPEYLECMRFWKRMYDEGLINRDFAVYDPGKWDDPYIAEKAGVKVDVCDTAGRWENRFISGGIDAEIGVIGAVAGLKGLRNLPTSGYNGMFMISKTSVKTEQDLRRVLKFLDQLNDQEMQDLLGWGIEGRHYTVINGEIEPVPEMTQAAMKVEVNGANQLLMYIPKVGLPRTRTEVRRLQESVIADNEQYVVGNPAEPLISDVYARRGPQLNDILIDAKVKFIVGQLDEAGFQKELERWNRTGGAEYIKEINELYKATK